ncbi:hypothetical protein EV649_1246 [Kribbella sp. VKM Ac-2569]|uniref:hypothetical protein n=1 Tax=Kribbella sp. VKM Ac-2569 TaxID=2512220 RepID=UPI00102B58D1|nr:hypothetical protein [Kribbella sp. VKM Ac-2569]RZT27480.1 hypothetical protein EV649_1246 [Kribbella sp. VKM Ac-2569]
MTISDELDRTRAALLALEKSLMALRNRVGPHLDVLRLLDDLSAVRRTFGASSSRFALPVGTNW